MRGVLSVLLIWGLCAGIGTTQTEPAHPTEPNLALLKSMESIANQINRDQSRMREIGDELTIHHHDLRLTLDPDHTSLSATTTEQIEVRLETRQIHLLLFRDFTVSAIAVTSNNQPLATSYASETLVSDRLIDDMIATFGGTLPTEEFDVAAMRSEGLNAQILTIQLPSFTKKGDRLAVTVTYAGSYADLNMEPFADEALYLNGSEFWFPDVLGPLSTFDLTISGPEAWQIWSQGHLVNETVAKGLRTLNFHSDVPQGQIVVIAGAYTVQRQTIDGIEFASYLFPETATRVVDSPLMEKSIEYVRFFAERVGTYPFESFAIIETTADIGQGFPSFTLLGGHVINAHFLDPYALGHEILHSWFGNYVIWNGEGGNWTEGITFYLANLLYDEVTQGPEFARQQRKRTLEDLSYALRWDDVPTINEFISSNDPRYPADVSQNIGYHKLGMLIHGWRTWLGDEAFFQMLRTFVTDFGGKQASLLDLTGAFYDALAAQGKVHEAKEAWLSRYSADWYDQKGMPFLVLDHVFMHRVEPGGTYDGELALKVSDFDGGWLPPARMSIYDGPFEAPTQVYSDRLLTWTDESALMEPFDVSRPPNWLEVDPAYDQLRWIPDSEKTPSLEFLRKTGPTSLVATAADLIVITEHKFDLPRLFVGPSTITLMPPDAASTEKVTGTNIFAIGTPEDQSWIEDLLTRPFGVTTAGSRTVALTSFFDLNGYDAIFRVVKNEEDPITCRGAVYGKDMEAVLALLRKLPFYPMESWIGLKDGKVVDYGRDLVELRSLRYPLWDFENK